MHQALCIDEVICRIFELASQDESKVLSVLARTCRTWSDPALDYLWVSLPSVHPLILLIPNISQVNQIYVPNRRLYLPDLLRFEFYASRVKFVNFRKNIEVHPDITLLLRQRNTNITSRSFDTLPLLRYTKLSGAGLSPLTLCLARSNALQDLEIDLGFAPGLRTPFPEDYVGDLLDSAPHLRRMVVRGTLTTPLTRKITTKQSLTSLSLRCGRSLNMEGLFEVLSLPNLQELEIPLSHFDQSTLQDCLSLLCSKRTFSPLQKMCIRGQIGHIQSLLDALPMDDLVSLSADIDESFNLEGTWNTLFSAIRSAWRLQSLQLQHFIDLDDIDNTTHTSNHEITHLDLQLLGSLCHLEQLVLDTTLPPAINDEQLKGLLEHWPRLNSLDFGPGLDCFSEGESGSSLTFQALDVITAQAPKLAKLRLPIMDAGSYVERLAFNGNIQSALEQLTLGGASKLDSQRVVPYLYQTFPCLKILDGLSQTNSRSCS